MGWATVQRGRSTRLSLRSRARLGAFSITALCLIWSCRSHPPSSTKPTQPPNVLLFVVDALRADALGVYGNDRVETPEIDRFAEAGAVFEQAFAQSSWTRPSVTSILTGLHPSVHGVETRKDALSPSLTFLPEVFRGSGYRTGFLIANPNVGAAFGFSRGFDDFIELYGRREEGRVSSQELVARADRVVDRAKEWLEEVSEPFFLVVFVVDPHFPYDPPPDFHRYVEPGDSDPRRGLYDGEVSFVDRSFGRLMADLDGRRLSERTITILTSDHGEEFFEHGQIGHGKALYEESLHVPLIVRWPGEIEAGRRIESPVELVDLMPTVLELTRLPPPPLQDGRSLFQPREGAPTLLAGLKLDGQRKWSARAYPWKLILDRGSPKLFDLSSDPGEMRDLSGEEADRVRELRLWVTEREENDERRRMMVHAGGQPGEGPEGELSEGVREALRELGYIK